jgi:hypothetical protein
MDSERVLKIELHRALDEVLPPAPWLEAAVHDDLRRRRRPKSVDRNIGIATQRRVALPRPVFQLAAGALIIVLLAVAVVTFAVLRYRAQQIAPAGSITAYQAMVNRDDNRLDAARNNSCVTLQSVCPAPGEPVLMALQRWSADLNASQPPARFAVIDGELRRHVEANISDILATIAAYNAHDQSGLDRAYNAGTSQGGWLDTVASGIIGSHPGTAVAYMESVQAEEQKLAACTSCQSLVNPGQVDCIEIQSALCEADIAFATSAIGDFEADLVRVAAPTSLAADDALLQRDLALADSAVLHMSSGDVAGDQSAFNGALLLLQQVLPTVGMDGAEIRTRSAVPAGGPVPAQLLGDWLIPAAAAQAIDMGACPTPVTVSTCMFRLTFTATTYNWTIKAPGFSDGGGDVVVNGNEIDFFNGQACSTDLPQGVGRYTWTLTNGVLHFAPLNTDICPRQPFLANQSYTRTGS